MKFIWKFLATNFNFNIKESRLKYEIKSPTFTFKVEKENNTVYTIKRPIFTYNIKES